MLRADSVRLLFVGINPAPSCLITESFAGYVAMLCKEA